ncbi:uncharacterized protein LOC134271719 [Saccostrea cucullata]|uniref:uncharacterized protein LOC134271719 n=1 Tax=Saccostrea cuccullata TaxID=36930 RepID=UPI002ED33AAD
MTLVTIGLSSFVTLIIAAFRSKLTTDGNNLTNTADPSLNLRIVFLWIFGLAVIVHISINTAIYVECIPFISTKSVEATFSLLSSIILILFLLIQLSFISYYRGIRFIQTTIVNFSCIFILVANFVIWFNTFISDINVFHHGNDTVPRYSNASYCFRTSKIQKGLAKHVTSFLIPKRMEFCILASSFIFWFLRWSSDETNEKLNYYTNKHFRGGSTSVTEEGRHIIGQHIFAGAFGIFMNVPFFLTTVLLIFALNWESEDAILALQIGEVLSSLCIILPIYVSSYHLKKYFCDSRRPEKLTANEYLLILSSSGTMAYYMFGTVTAFTLPGNFTHLKTFLCTRIILMLETFLQTHFLIQIRRFRPKGQSSLFISSGGVNLMMTNMNHWILNSTNKPSCHRNLETKLVDCQSWLYIINILIPLMLFYRFFSGISGYAIYYKFKPIVVGK